MKNTNGKYAIGLASLLLALATFASVAYPQIADTDAASKTKVYAFVKAALKGQTVKEIKGHTVTGEACALFFTDRSQGAQEDYYVVVGYLNAKSKNDYIGVVASQSTVGKSWASVQFFSAQPWGNETRYNRVTIRPDLSEAVGISDLKEIDCKMD